MHLSEYANYTVLFSYYVCEEFNLSKLMWETLLSTAAAVAGLPWYDVDRCGSERHDTKNL